MVRVLLGTDVLADHMLAREPYAADAGLLVELGALCEVDLYMTPGQFIALHEGLVAVGTAPAEARRAVVEARRAVKVAAVGAPELDAALSRDREDMGAALIAQAARAVHADAIVTRDGDGLPSVQVPIFDCDGFFRWMAETKDVEYVFTDLP